MQDLTHQSSGDWFLLTALFVGAIICLLAALRMFHRARLIEDMPTSKIRSCPQGYVELHGTAKWMEGPEIHAPLSGQPCVWYSFVVEKYVGHSKQKWRSIDSGVSDNLFLLEDDTGSCLIDPDGANVTPSTSTTWQSSKRLRPATHTSPLDIHKIFGGAIFGSSEKYRYTEQRIDHFEFLYAIGEYNSLGTSHEESLKDAATAYLRDLKKDKDKLAVYDVNKDGKVDLEEWEQARNDAKKAVIEQRLSSPLPERMHVLRKPNTKKYQPFLLSSKSEIHMTRKNRMISAGLMFLFVVLTVSVFLKLIGKI